MAPVAMDDGDGVDLASESGEAQMNQDVGPPSPSQAWYDDIGVYGGTDAATAGGSVDVAMSLLDDTDRRILASVILGVDVVEVYSPERVNRLAKKFGLTPGASMDLTNGY